MKRRSYWVPLEALAAADPTIEVRYAENEREFERLTAAGSRGESADKEDLVVVTDLSATVGIARLRSLLPDSARILALIPSSKIAEAQVAIGEGLYDYVLCEHPERLSLALAHIRHECDVEREARDSRRRIHATEEQHRFLIENILDIITVTDINATILYESASLERVLGYKPEELIGKNAFSLIHPLDIPRTMPVFMLAIATPGVPHSTRFRFKHKNGSWRMLEVVGKTLRDPELGFRLIVTSRDITDRERAQEALGQSEMRFRSVVENLSEGLSITTRDGDVSYFNSRMTELTGYEPNEVLGKKLYSMIFPEEMWRERHGWINSKAARTPQKMETEILRKDGSKLWVEVRTTPYQDGDQHLGTISAFVDITERRQFEQQLQLEREQALEAKEYAETMNRLKSHFLENLSHEIRTPLTGILGFAQLLNEQLTDEELKVYSTLITSAGSRLLETMNALIDLSTIESGRLELNQADVELNEEVERVAGLMRTFAESKLLTLHVAVPEETIVGHVDPHYFAESLRHVIGNAIKFTEVGSIDITLGIESATQRAVVSVQDRGIGISAEFIPYLCEPFRQESDGFGRKFEGNGLGLTLTKNFVEAMGGSIMVESTPGEGSTFRLYFPLTGSPVKRGLLSRLGIR